MRSRLVTGLFVLLVSGCSATQTQVRNTDSSPPPWRDTTGQPGVYPSGPAVDVYRAVLDLYFTDGKESPSVIVMSDTAQLPSNGGPCPVPCDKVWEHKSKIDQATTYGYARYSPKAPRMIPFAYRIPIVFLSSTEEARMRAIARPRLIESHRGNYVPEVELLDEFDRRFPGAWGRLRLSRVGFNPAYSQAIVQANFLCGIMCYSDEILFLEKIDQHWTVIERIPNSAEGFLPWGTMRYRGPAGRVPSESEVLATSGGVPNAAAVAEGVDRAAVYRAVLDSLYNFHGDSPRRIVVTDHDVLDTRDLAAVPERSRLAQQATLERYAVLGMVRAPLYAKLDYRLPVSILPRDSIPAFEQRGRSLQKPAEDKGEEPDTSPFWLAFREQYPDAWGMVGFTRVAFNADHTQAIVYSDHMCGQFCRNSDTWVLDRSGEKWRVVERLPAQKENHWGLDSLRYLGVDADPNAYRPRRIHGVVVNAATRQPLPGLRVQYGSGPKSYVLTTDSAGRYSIGNVAIMLWTTMLVACPNQPSRQPLMPAQIPSHPGLDTTVNVAVDFRQCIRPTRAHPLLAGAISPQALKSTYPDPEAAAVYRGVLDVLYPPTARSKGPILLHPITFHDCDWCVDHEFPRLISQGVIDSSMAKNFLKLPKDSVWFQPTFAYRRKVIILSPAEQKFLLDQAESTGGYDRKDVSLVGLARDAYPGADSIWGFSRVAFNDARSQALVQVGTKVEYWLQGETMLLKKVAGSWRVVRRHLEREKTSGQRVGDRCEPVDAPSGHPSLSQLEAFVGDVHISSVGTSPGLRGDSGTMHLRFTPTDTLHRFYWLPSLPGDKRKPIRRNGQQVLATVQIMNDSTGKARTGIAGSFEQFGNGATIWFSEHREGYITFDGWSERYNILRVNGREFFGNWQTQSGPTIPWLGYFCGRL